MMPSRRAFLRAGLVVLAAPAIVRFASLMPVRAVSEEEVVLLRAGAGLPFEYQELVAISPRALVGMDVAQLYWSHPLLNDLIAR